MTVPWALASLSLTVPQYLGSIAALCLILAAVGACVNVIRLCRRQVKLGADTKSYEHPDGLEPSGAGEGPDDWFREWPVTHTSVYDREREAS